MPGFPREEQLLLSVLVGGHRRQLSFESLEDLLPPWDRLAEFLIVLLRIAVLLASGTQSAAAAGSEFDRQKPQYHAAIAAAMDEGASLTLEDLEQERAYLKEVGFRLTIT